VPQKDANATGPTPLVFVADARRRARDRPDPDYERAWAAEIMGLVESGVKKPRRPRIAEIQRATAKHFGITVDEMLDGQRIRKVTVPRHAAMYLTKQLTLKSFAEIGRAFAGRDHSTVVHAVNGITARLQFDDELTHQIACIRNQLQADVPPPNEDKRLG
jgi:chromosomal replication initiation ATPase DnaA